MEDGVHATEETDGCLGTIAPHWDSGFVWAFRYRSGCPEREIIGAPRPNELCLEMRECLSLFVLHAWEMKRDTRQNGILSN